MDLYVFDGAYVKYGVNFDFQGSYLFYGISILLIYGNPEKKIIHFSHLICIMLNWVATVDICLSYQQPNISVLKHWVS